MRSIKTETKWFSFIFIIILSAFLVLAAAAMLSLSLCSRAAGVQNVYNVYVGEKDLCRAFADAHREETGWTDEDQAKGDACFADDSSADSRLISFRHFYTNSDDFADAVAELNTADPSSWLYKAIRESNDALAPVPVSWDAVRINVWILKDVSAEGGDSGTALFNAGGLETKVGGRDVMINLVGTAGYGSVAGDRPLLSVKNSSSHITSGIAFSTKNITVRFTGSTSATLPAGSSSTVFRGPSPRPRRWSAC